MREHQGRKMSCKQSSSVSLTASLSVGMQPNRSQHQRNTRRLIVSKKENVDGVVLGALVRGLGQNKFGKLT